MQWVTACGKALHVQDRPSFTQQIATAEFKSYLTGRAVHELLYDPVAGDGLPLFPALVGLGGGRQADRATPRLRKLVWIDSAGSFYPPAAVGGGIASESLWIVRAEPQHVMWAAMECLRCPGVDGVVALLMDRPSRADVRRLQLAAEKGGGIGLLLRPNLASAAPHIYSAATRWVVSPSPGERTIQRWRLELIHGHGWHIGQTFLLEKHRATGQTHFVSIPTPLVNYPSQAAAS